MFDRSGRLDSVTSHVCGALVFAVMFASALALLRWHRRRGNPRPLAQGKRLIWFVAGLLLLLAIVMQLI